jgi:hypothetical protein
VFRLDTCGVQPVGRQDRDCAAPAVASQGHPLPRCAELLHCPGHLVTDVFRQVSEALVDLATVTGRQRVDDVERQVNPVSCPGERDDHFLTAGHEPKAERQSIQPREAVRQRGPDPALVFLVGQHHQPREITGPGPVSARRG